VEKIARFVVGLVAACAFGATAYWGLQTADAQSGGGFPSRPTFITVGTRGGGQSVLLTNSAGTFASGLVQDYIRYADSGGNQAYIGFGGTPNSIDISNGIATNGFISLLSANGTIVGAPVGGAKGSGTLNVQNTIYQNNIPVVQAFDATLAAGGVTVNNSVGLGTVAGTRSGVGIYQVTYTAGTVTRATCSQRSNGGIPAVIQIASLGGGVINFNAYTLGGALSDVTGSWDCVAT
jgi:hypothetical protein